MTAQSSTLPPLSRAMLGVISCIVRAIDTRVNLLDDAQEEDYEPETCDTCGGTGFIMVPSSADVMTHNEIDVKGYEAPAPVEPVTVATQTPTVIALADVESSAPTATPPAPVPAVASSSVVPVAGGTAIGGAPAPAPLPANNLPPASAPLSANNLPPAPAPLPAINLPPPSTPIPGFIPLGPNTAVPHPTNAVYCNHGAERYYSVTKGIRVGVYSGWQNTSPYVTGVASASYSRHRTIHAAYDAYCSAYYAGFVSYA